MHATVDADGVVDFAAHRTDTAASAHYRYQSLGEPAEACGFPLPARMREELRAIDLAKAQLEPGLPVLLLESVADGAARETNGPRSGWQQQWERRGHPVERRTVGGPGAWEAGEQRTLVPQAAVQQIATWLRGAS